jgi:hypothetical protein
VTGNKGREAFRFDTKDRRCGGIANHRRGVFRFVPIQVGNVVPGRRPEGSIQSGGESVERQRDVLHRPPGACCQQSGNVHTRDGGRPANVKDQTRYTVFCGRCGRIFAERLMRNP